MVRAQVPEEDALVLALPRGGVPVGFAVARALGAPLDVLLVRKLGVPGEEELAMGAIASGGVRVLNRDLIAQLGVPAKFVEDVVSREGRELQRRETLYRAGRPALPVRGQTVVLTDDGLATGASMLAAARALRSEGARRVIAAAPVGSRQACEQLRREVEGVVCAAMPEPFGAVGAWYDDFSPTTDQEVCELLAAGQPPSARDRERLDPDAPKNSFGASK